MEKEYPVINARQSKKNILHFAAYIASLTDAGITGVFLERHEGQLQPVLRNIREMPLAKKTAASSTGIQNTGCGKYGQQEAQNVGADMEAIVKESRFSDMLILDAEMSFDKDQTGVLSDLSKSILTKSECPVMIAPYAFEEIEEIIFACDASPSAIYAIKQFALLFPALTDKNLTVLQVNSREEESITDRQHILGLLQVHYSSIGFRTLTGTASDAIFNYLSGRRNAIVIMGAFGSPQLTAPRRQSTAGPLIKTINLPLFIAHQHYNQ